MVMRLPESIEEVSLEDIRAAITLAVRQAEPRLTIDEGSPVYHIIDILSTREMLLREYFNVRVRRNLIRYATGQDLDEIGLLLNLPRNTQETDVSYRGRLEVAYAVASPVAETAFLANAQAAVPTVFDANYLVSDIKDTAVYVLSDENQGGVQGMPSDATREAVLAYLNNPARHLITDTLSCPVPTLVEFEVRARVSVSAGFILSNIQTPIRDALRAYSRQTASRLGRPWFQSEIVAAIQAQPGVRGVTLVTGTTADQPNVPNNTAYYIHTPVITS